MSEKKASVSNKPGEGPTTRRASAQQQQQQQQQGAPPRYYASPASMQHMPYHPPMHPPYDYPYSGHPRTTPPHYMAPPSSMPYRPMHAPSGRGQELRRDPRVSSNQVTPDDRGRLPVTSPTSSSSAGRPQAPSPSKRQRRSGKLMLGGSDFR